MASGRHGRIPLALQGPLFIPPPAACNATFTSAARGAMMDGASTPDPLQDADNRNILQVDEAPCLSFDHQRFTYVVQPIAGMLARRVVCRVQPGSVLEQGQRYGLIHFGSRMDLTLPPEAEVKAGVGDTLKGGETVLAILKEPHPL